MLEFIVLGQIPGTSIYLTFFDVVMVAAGAAVAGLIVWFFRPVKSKKKQIEQILEIAL